MQIQYLKLQNPGNCFSRLRSRAGFRLDEALTYLRYGALYKSRYSMSVTNMIFGYLEG
jgi:hypothetical protein